MCIIADDYIDVDEIQEFLTFVNGIFLLRSVTTYHPCMYLLLFVETRRARQNTAQAVKIYIDDTIQYQVITNQLGT